uniref:Uncharacterized protein n=1 Tax=Kalanchoe fedtschenkoi TaxID=63787 RepID=A0A7N0ZW73_KALFE
MSSGFSMSEPHHFSDYGFDPQITHFQFAEESRRRSRRASLKPIDALRFKLQKPISKDESRRASSKTKKKRWWKSALGYLKGKWAERSEPAKTDPGRAATHLISAGPVYVTESRSGSTTPYRDYLKTSPFRVMKGGQVELPYVSLREMNVGEQQRMSTSSPPMPIYLVT